MNNSGFVCPRCKKNAVQEQLPDRSVLISAKSPWIIYKCQNCFHVFRMERPDIGKLIREMKKKESENFNPSER